MAKRILVVEDSRTEALRARLILEREGYQVSLASDGQEGLSKAAQEKPDLILLGTVLPHMNGYEVCGRLRLDPKTSAIPIVILPVEDEIAHLPHGLGSDCFLAKPFTPVHLVDKVKQVIASDGQAAKLPISREITPPNETVEKLGQMEEELDRYKAELRLARQEADAANQARSYFLANMSHELRTPLHELMGMTDLALNTELMPEQRNYLNTAKVSSNALLAFISDILEFSEMEGGEVSLEEKNFDLGALIESVVELMAPRAREKGLDFSSHVSTEAPRALVGDPQRLRQILVKLVDNAIKFTDRGKVSIRVVVDPRGGTREDEADLHFIVSDTGIGIPADQHKTVFEPFRQIDATSTRRYGGLGLGLALVQQFVGLMEGNIWVESEVGKGSVFHLTLTLRRQEETASLPRSTARPALERVTSLQILLAEDSPTNQLIAVANLKKAGHTVTVANNGLKAVRAFEQAGQRGTRSLFDLVLMDIAMPEMDGLEATRAIREKEEAYGGHIPIIAMTAFTTKEYQEKCMEAGMDAYVSKPVRIDELNRSIEPLLFREPMVELSAPAPLPSPVVLAEALEVVGGDVDILRDAVAMSLEEIPGQMAALKQAMVQQNVSEVEAKAHRLKGVMGNLGGLIARDAAQRLETMGERGNLEGGPDVATALEKEIGRVSAFYADPTWEQRARECEATDDG